MLATQEDLLRLDGNITSLRRNQADLVTKIDELSGNLAALNSQLESSQGRMTSLSQKLDDLQSDLARRMNVLSGQVTGTSSAGGASTPGDLFRLAYNDYQAGKFDLAIVGFRNLLTQHPKSDVAAQAQFFAGESEFGRKNFVDAAREYERVVQHYPRSEFAPRALYKRGVAFQQVGKTADAREVLQRLLRDYPKHELSRSARDLLKTLD